MTKEMLISLHKKGMPIDVVIDTLIDDFESRTCGSCKYYSMEYEEIGICLKGVCEDSPTIEMLKNGVDNYNRKSFSCNKWSAKDD